MSTALTVVNAEPELESLKTRIAQYDDGFRRAYSQQMGYAFLAGLAIKRAKELLAHGKFLPWIESEAKLSRRSAHRYVCFVDALIDESPSVAKVVTKCATAVAHLTDGGIAELGESEQKEIIAAVHEATDGKTLTELYRDLGVIRQPKKQQHHPKKITPEEEEESKNLMALDRINSLTGDLRQLLHEWEVFEKDGGELPTLSRAPSKARQELDSVRIDLGKVLAKIKKAGRKSPLLQQRQDDAKVAVELRRGFKAAEIVAASKKARRKGGAK